MIIGRPTKHLAASLLLLTTLTLVGLLPAGVSSQADPFGGGSIAAPPGRDVVSARVLLSRESVAAGNSYDAAVIINIDRGWHINSVLPYQDFLIPATITADTVQGIAPHSFRFPSGHDMQLLGELMSLYDGEVVVPFKITVPGTVADGDYSLPVAVRYQACDDQTCAAPQTRELSLAITVGEEGAPAHQSIFADIESAPPTVEADQLDETEQAAVAPRSDLQELIDEHGFWGYFLALGLAFVTGLLLSFSPCTYPMIPITVSIFAGQQRSVGRGFVLSLFYVGTMAVVYGIMGLVVSLVGGVFGAWLALPGVVIGISIVFVIFSLSMFGLYEFQVPMSLRNKLGAKGGGGGVGGSIVLGIVAALVVSPCVGPFVAGILLYIANVGSPVLGFLTLFIFALGLGTLYVIIGTFSSAINALPGSGGWMEQVKKFFGFVLLLMAMYFLSGIISPTLTAVLTGLILLALGVFGGGLDRLTSDASFFPRLKKFVGLIALLVGIYLIGGTIISQGLILPPASDWLPVSGGTALQKEEIPWKTDLTTGLALAEEQNKPVLIDTWATWCVNCKVLDKKTFQNERVIEAAKRFVPLKIQLETAQSETTKQFMERFGMSHYSLPTVLILDSAGHVKRVIQGVIGPDEMIEELRKVS